MAMKKMAGMLGCSREEMIGSFIWDYADEEDKGSFHIKLANRKRGIDEVYECILLRKTRSYIWLLVSAKALFDIDGKFAGSLGMFTYISERKKAEEVLRGCLNIHFSHLLKDLIRPNRLIIICIISAYTNA